MLKNESIEKEEELEWKQGMPLVRDGKAYYGNVYFVGGTKYAGTTTGDGTDIRVYDTRIESIENPTTEKLQSTHAGSILLSPDRRS